MTFPTGATGSFPGQRLTGARDKIPRGLTKGQFQQFTPEQMNLFQSLFSQTGPNSYLSRLSRGDQSLFEEIEAPALKQFGELQGQLASRFSGMGSGARRSSGFNLASSQATQDFAQQLQAQRMGLQRQALGDLMGISESLLGQRPYEQFVTQRKTPFWKQLLAGISPAAGQAIGTFGGMGASKMAGFI